MHPAQPQLPAVDVAEVEDARRPGDPARPLLVDVRERGEFVEVRVPGAVLYPTSSFLLRFEELPRDRPIHVICRTGNRSAAVTAFLLRNGWPQVSNVTGGMVAWLRAGLEVRRGPLDPGEGDLP